jgi:DNA-binding response OmpR family regulator
MRFLIVDESGAFRAELSLMLRERWPDAETVEWDPRRQGSPLEEIARGGYAAVLLEAEPAGEDGLAWVAQVRKDQDAPPVVLITKQGGEHLAVKAMKAGAADFLPKAGLTPEQLVISVQEALREHEARHIERTNPEMAFLRTSQFNVAKIGLPVRDTVQRVRGYRIVRKIGEGGMAQVYLAERERDGIQLALKILTPTMRNDEVFRKRFEREYKLLVAIENEHVARIYDQGFAGGNPFIAMEYFPGGDLKVRLVQPVTSLGALRIA